MAFFQNTHRIKLAHKIIMILEQIYLNPCDMTFVNLDIFF